MEPEQITYRVVIAPAVYERMYEHFEFLERVSENAAYKLVDSLVRDIRSLEQMPHRNPPYDRPYLSAGKYRYKLSCGRYRIVYQIENNIVYVDDIQDCRQDETGRSLSKP